ncbi:MAG: hypothetical protein IPK03_16895 [Bacteroidetes bacterium]|nr:hypothetical protein [Bacteroidota bacterium]
MNRTDFSPSSKIWIYQSERLLDEREEAIINARLAQFVQSWTAHSHEVKGHGAVYHRAMIVLMADESHTQVSGCSIDSSVKFIKAMGAEMGIDFFDRKHLVVKVDGALQIALIQDIQSMISNGIEQIEVFDNLILTKEEWDTAWLKPLSESRYKRMFDFMKIAPSL